MEKSYRKNQYGERNYLAKSKENKKLKEYVKNQRISPLMYGRLEAQHTLKNNGKLNSSSGFIAMNTLTSPSHSVFEKKIRQAIEMRYMKSKINNYIYTKIQDFRQQECQKENQSSSESRKSSQESQEMQEMRDLAYLKNVSFVNIHHFHSQKYEINQKSKEKDKNKKRRFKVPFSYDSQNHDHKRSDSKRDQYEQKLLIKSAQTNIKQPVNLANKKLEESQTLNCKDDLSINHSIVEQKQKRFLTSRLPYQANPRAEQNILKPENLSTLSPSGEKLLSSQNKYKDTFKLKYTSKILSKIIQKNEESQNQQIIQEEVQKTERTSKKEKPNANRRFLFHKNQKLQNIKTQPDKISQVGYHMKNINNDSSYQKIASLRKIETQFIEPIANQHQIYNKTTKNKAKMIKNYRNNHFLMNKINQSSQKSFHSASEQKWKLQEISFKFKPVNQLQKDSKNNEIQKIQENKNHALKLGLSLQKAYSKLLENKKRMQKKEDSSVRIYETSEEKKKRRLLRISPKNDNLHKNNEHRESKLKKDQTISFCSAILIENRSQESLSGERGITNKYKFLKNNKIERFSTIQ